MKKGSKNCAKKYEKQGISKIADKISKRANWLDYNKSIYISRLSMLLGVILLGHTGTLMATGHNTELKDNILKYFSANAVILGVDILLTKILYNLSERLFKTKR